jgi:hypothetical protein
MICGIFLAYDLVVLLSGRHFSLGCLGLGIYQLVQIKKQAGRGRRKTRLSPSSV